MSAREIANGFANRFIFVWAERTCLIAVPKPLDHALLTALAERLTQVVAFSKGAYPDEQHGKDTRAMQMTEAAEALYTTLYGERLNAPEACPVLDNLLQRRAPMLLRLAMLFAMTDLTLEIDVPHLNAALAWVSYWEASVRLIFARHDDLQQASLTQIRAEKVVHHLHERAGQPVSRSDISDKVFNKKLKATELDAVIHSLLFEKPPVIEQLVLPRQDGRKGGRSRKLYRLAV
jgi:putative DNA primase/helicase